MVLSAQPPLCITDFMDQYSICLLSEKETVVITWNITSPWCACQGEGFRLVFVVVVFL